MIKISSLVCLINGHIGISGVLYVTLILKSVNCAFSFLKSLFLNCFLCESPAHLQFILHRSASLPLASGGSLKTSLDFHVKKQDIFWKHWENAKEIVFLVLSVI